MTIKVAVIGCGNISQYHFSGLEKCGASVKWVCDLSAEAARPYAERFNARYSADYLDAVTDPEVDAVFVTLISSLHKQICSDAIRTGKAVVCEKTLALDSGEAVAITKLAQEHGTQLYTSYMKRFFPAIRKAKELLPELGRIIVSYVRGYQSWGNLWSTPPTEGFAWTPPGGQSIIRKNYGGGILTCGGSHVLDLTLYLLGRPERLFGSVYTPEGFDYDLRASAMLESKTNGIVHFDAVSHEMNKIGFMGDGWDEHLQINGVNGRLDLYTPQWTQFETKGARLFHHDKQNGQTTEYNFGCVSPFDLAVKYFCEQIEKGEQGEQSILTGYEVDELISTIQQSSDCRQALDIPWKL